MVTIFEPATKAQWYSPQIQGSRGREQVLRKMSLGGEEQKRAVRRQL